MSQNNEQVMRMALEALRPFYQDSLRIHPDWANERRRSTLTQEKPILVGDLRKAVGAFVAIEEALSAQAEKLDQLHQYEEIAEHYAKCVISPEALRDWVAERMDQPAQAGQKTSP